ncbi:Hypothetical protein HVR_LOCUS813 [uncultured virus]|nr:Hypothetical protein HVR_LOCUS813 [uncultured virus]
MDATTEFLDAHPERCRYQYVRGFGGSGQSYRDRFCGAKNMEGSKFCQGCDRRRNKNEPLRDPPCQLSEYLMYIFKAEGDKNAWAM